LTSAERNNGYNVPASYNRIIDILAQLLTLNTIEFDVDFGSRHGASYCMSVVMISAEDSSVQADSQLSLLTGT